jgi:hypothetical protein
MLIFSLKTPHLHTGTFQQIKKPFTGELYQRKMLWKIIAFKNLELM